MGKRSRRKALRRKVAKQPAPPPQDEPPVQDEPDTELHQLRLEHVTLLAEMDRHVYREAYQMFLAEGGDAIDLMLENGQLTMAAYKSQIRAAKEGGSGWGPTVTPYEDRMTRSLQMRLMRQKREWIEPCRQRILEEQKAFEERTAANEPDEEPEDSLEEEGPDTEEAEFGNPEPITAPETEAAMEPVLSTANGP